MRPILWKIQHKSSQVCLISQGTAELYTLKQSFDSAAQNQAFYEHHYLFLSLITQNGPQIKDYSHFYYGSLILRGLAHIYLNLEEGGTYKSRLH